MGLQHFRCRLGAWNLTSAAAIRSGEDRAWPSIRDSNTSTLITCAVLYFFGQQFGATIIMGFALVLAIGVAISLFSAIFVTRTLLELLLSQSWAHSARLFGMHIEPVPPRSLLAVLANLATLDEEFPPIEDLPPEPVDL